MQALLQLLSGRALRSTVQQLPAAAGAAGGEAALGSAALGAPAPLSLHACTHLIF